jgi:hypothetical protein
MNAEQEWSGRPNSADGPAGADGSPVDDELVEVAAFDEATAVRSATRALLGAGITPTVQVEGTRRLVLVAGGAARDAARVLGVPADEGASPGEPADAHGAPGAVASATVSPPDTVSPPGAVSPDRPAAALPAGITQAGEPPSEGPEVGPVVDHEGFASVALADDEAGARRIGATLMGAGIGARVLPAHERGFTATSVREAQVVQVLALEASRALSLLGTAPPRLPPGPEPGTTSGAATGSRAAPTSTTSGEGVEHSGTAGTARTGQPASAAGSQEPAGTAVTGGAGQHAGSAGAAGHRNTGTAGAAGPGTDSGGRPRRDPDEVRSYLGGRLQVTRRRLIAAVLIYLAALVLIPLAFFWATQRILVPDTPDPMINVPGVDQR